ncbi:class I SAM-dependent methyltransferase [Pannus brasiliensis CCIBt3594]|uniref:Class I SAM-dependent methyltransferase n=1 Tax=Pannus brasiliensis CCIBt3594 TaxID=1427578 RepID=A0AAW9QV00_9CHRO
MSDTVARGTTNSPGTSPLDPRTAPGHQVLAAAGKKFLRPGGRTATRQLFEMANFQPGETVLELASSFGYSSIDLASRYGVNVIGIEKNPESVERARANVASAGLSDRITFIEGDIFRLDEIDRRFDAVVAEAILSMQSAPAKAKILTGVSALLEPGGRFLSHELLIEGNEAEIYPALRGAIRVNTTPLSGEGWRENLANAGLIVTRHQIGAMGLLDPRTVLRDEGILDTLKIAWNLLARPDLRQRVLEMREVFDRYRHELGYILLLARKSAGANR